ARRKHKGRNRGREGVTLPALRTVRAVFPHTALQSVVSSSGVSRGAPSPIQGERPGLREEVVGPEANRPPLTPLTSADTMRSIHAEASTHDRGGRFRWSAPCLAKRALPVLFLASSRLSRVHLPTPFPKCGFAFRTSRGSHRCGTMRALTPARRSNV